MLNWELYQTICSQLQAMSRLTGDHGNLLAMTNSHWKIIWGCVYYICLHEFRRIQEIWVYILVHLTSFATNIFVNMRCSNIRIKCTIGTLFIVPMQSIKLLLLSMLHCMFFTITFHHGSRTFCMRNSILELFFLH